MLRSHHSLEPFKQATICILNLISTYKMSLSLSGPPYSMQCIHLTYFTMFLKTIMVFENHLKSLIQHCERSELRLHFE